MKTAVFSSKSYDRERLTRELKQVADSGGNKIECTFLEVRLTPETAILARGHTVVCCFVHDELGPEVIEILAQHGVRHIAMRCAGYNNVDLRACRKCQITVSRVPAYSPYAVAEHAVGLILELNRKYSRAYNRVRDNNFSLDGLEGFDLHGKTVGVVGTGKIGVCFARIMLGFGCRVVAFDIQENSELLAAGVCYMDLAGLFAESDIISLHCPLNEHTQHLINEKSIAGMKCGVMVINTSRGPLIDTGDIIAAVKSGQVGYLGMDVYEEEAGVFFEDFSSRIIGDDQLMRLTTFPNVRITSHQAFFTHEALDNIARTAVENLVYQSRGEPGPNLVSF
ncbi:MAG: 2-hydroxyacid dehydrogenase [Verrucomicrobiota bacterium]